MINKFLGALLAGTLAALALATAAGADHNTVQLISTGPTGGNAASAADYKFISQDGSRVVFQTMESLVAADTDTRIDIYERVGSTTNLVSTGPAGGNGGINATFVGASGDGSRIFFHTTEKLVATDTDSQNDVYERTGGTTNLMSIGPTGGNLSIPAFYDGNSDNGTIVWFHSGEKLVAADTDSSSDVYQRSGGTTTQVSIGAIGGNGANAAFFDGASGSGARVFFSTDEGLESNDTDAFFDVYERSGGSSTKVSIGPSSGNASTDAFFDGSSSDGTRVFFSTDEAMTADDTDSNYDVFQRFSGATTRLSTGSAGNGNFDAFFDGSSSDGTRVFIETDEALAAGDTDSAVDIFERTGATTTRLSTGPAGGNGSFDAEYAGASSDGLHVYFETDEIIRSEDVDSFADVYERSGGATTLVSLGPSGGNGSFEAAFEGVSTTGDHVFFSTEESLVSTDTDTAADVYERSASGVSLVSGGLTGGNGPDDAIFGGSSSSGAQVAFTSTEQLVNTDTDITQDVYLASIAPGFARPGSGTPLRVPLMLAYSPCISPNSSHVAPFNIGACRPPVQSSTELTNSNEGRAAGFVKLRAVVGNPATPADEADVRITASITDVLRRNNGSDYTGQVALELGLRITDRGSGSSQTAPATVQDTNFALPISCVAHPAGPVGGSCDVDASADALVPGFAREGANTILAVTRVRVLDAGPNNSLTPLSGACPPTCGNGDERTFLEEGVFTP